MKKNDLKINDTVQIVLLLDADRSYEGSDDVHREPQVGDVGAVLDPYDLSHPDASCLVEMFDPHGKTIWLANFQPEELKKANFEFPPTERPFSLYLCVFLAMFVFGTLWSILNGYRFFCDGLNSCDQAGNLVHFDEVIRRTLQVLLFLAVMSLPLTFILIRGRREKRREALTQRR